MVHTCQNRGLKNNINTSGFNIDTNRVEELNEHQKGEHFQRRGYTQKYGKFASMAHAPLCPLGESLGVTLIFCRVKMFVVFTLWNYWNST